MDEFGIDLDKVLDEFEQSEDGNAAEADGIRREEISDEMARPEVDQPRLAANFPAFEALDLDLAEADFAPSCWNFSASPGEENSDRNDDLSESGPSIDANSETLPMHGDDRVQGNNENHHHVPEVVAFLPHVVQMPGEVDVLSACRHALVGPPEPYEPVVQERRENVVEGEVVPGAAPPDIVCSTPDLVSSAIVGVDVVPISCANGGTVGNVTSNLDLTLAQTVPVASRVSHGRPDATVQDVSTSLRNDLMADSSCSSAANEERSDLPCDEGVSENAEIILVDGQHLEGSSSTPDPKESHEVEVGSFSDGIPSAQRSNLNSSSNMDSGSSDKYPTPLNEEIRFEVDFADDSSSSTSPPGISFPSDIVCGISEEKLSAESCSSASCNEVALRADVEPFKTIDQKDTNAGGCTHNDIEIASSEETQNHEIGKPVGSHESLPDISQISISGVEFGELQDSVSGEAHDAPHEVRNRLDEGFDEDTDHETTETNPDRLQHPIKRNERSPDAASIKHQMPPAYWDTVEESKTRESSAMTSYEKFGDLVNDLNQMDDISDDDDDSFIEKVDNENTAERVETTYPEAVENDSKSEKLKGCLDDPEIIKDGKVADTNFTGEPAELTASTPGRLHTVHEIQSGNSFAVLTQTVDDESHNVEEEIKYDLDLVSDVIMIESLPEFCDSDDETGPDVVTSDNSAVEVKVGSSHDGGFTDLNSRDTVMAGAINAGHVPEVFGNLEDETFKNLMNEVAEEMERMIGQVNADASGCEGVSGLDVVARKNPENGDSGKNLKDSFEDQAVFVHCNGSEKHGSETLQEKSESFVLETGMKLFDGASDGIPNHHPTEPEAVDCRQNDTSHETTKASPGQLSRSAKGDVALESKMQLPESQIDLEESASSIVTSQLSAATKENIFPAESSEETLPLEIPTGARRKQTIIAKPETLCTLEDEPVLTATTVVMPEGAHATTPAVVATHGTQPSSILQPSTSPSFAASPTIPLCSNIGLDITQLGKVAPVWLPDAEASKCMECEVPFSFTRRRHHCRACGKVFCHGCSSLRATLPYLENRQDRVCSKCYQDLVRAPYYERSLPVVGTRPNQSDSDSSPAQAQASPETQPQPSSANAPTGVLRKQGSMKLSGEAKQVMFSDGVRPGGSLTELDGSSEVVRTTSSRRSRKSDKASSQAASASSSSQARTNPSDTRRSSCLISSSGLLPVVMIPTSSGEFLLNVNVPPDDVFQQIKNAQDSSSVMLAINQDVSVSVKMVNLDCCVNRLCWCFSTKGLCTVGQDEIVIVLECLPDEKTVPVDILRHLHVVYEMASHGNTVNNLDHTVLAAGSLGCQEIGGFLYVRQTFQCLQKLVLPEPPYLFGLLLQKWEMSWARVFPLRLMFRLGAEFRYYPCPLISVRNRKSVYGEIGHTIMNLLADFHNYQYMVPRINGLVIHMEDKRTTVSIPQNRHKMLMKILNNSDDHVIALGASFSSTADSHLVCLQSDDGNYQTQAINIQNRPRRVTGACFIVFNGALKPTSGLRAKSSIVEDGLMVQVTSDAMTELKQVLSEMKGYRILCGSVDIAQPDEMVVIEWNNEEKNINQGVKSPIDGLSMFGVDSIRIHGSTDHAKENLSIRWTEVFVLRNGTADGGTSSEAPADLSHLSESLAQACCQALVKHLGQLTFEMFTKIGLRVTIESEQVGYEIGSCGVRLPGFCMNDLDEKLISVIHGAASRAQTGPIVLELIFHIIHPFATRSDTNTAPATN